VAAIKEIEKIGYLNDNIKLYGVNFIAGAHP